VVIDNEVGPVEQGEWLVERIGDDPVRIPGPPSIRFDGEGSFTGSTGVNRMFGSYAIVDGVLSTSAAGTTLMAGPDERMEVEQRFLAALNAGGSIEVVDGIMRIGADERQLTLRAAEPADEDEGGAAVTGRVAYRERIAMPAGAVLTVSLLDVSAADAAADLIARIVVPDPGNVPIDFELPYDSSLIDDDHMYAVRATIEVEGSLGWTSTDAQAVITRGNPTSVEVALDRAPS
jgi:uncharacterized lipoprotein YbaY/heat shock protein HslJ